MAAEKKKPQNQKHKFSLGKIFLPSQSIIGLDAGSSCIKIVQVKKSQDTQLITHYQIYQLPPEVKGNPQEKRKIVKDLLKNFISKRRIKIKGGGLTIGEKGSYILTLAMPFMPAKNLKQAVSIELKKKLPFQVDLNNILFDFFVTDDSQGEKGRILQVTCIVMEKYILEENIGILKGAGIKPMAVNVAPLALGNLLRVISKDIDCAAILDMGAQMSVISLYKKGLLQFNRQIPLGGEHFTESIMTAMTTLGKDGVNKAAAEELKYQCGIPLEEEVFSEYATSLGAIKGSQLTGALRPLLERYNTEISRTINYYYRIFHRDKIDCLYFTGGCARLKNMDKFLAFNLPILNITKIEKLDPLGVIKVEFPPDASTESLEIEKDIFHLSAALGVCMEEKRGVNFLPPEQRLEEKINSLIPLAKISVFLLAGIVLYFSATCILYKKFINAKQKEITQFASKANEVKNYITIRDKFSEKELLLKKAVGREPFWWGVLKELSNITPDEIIFEQLEIKNKVGGKELYLIGEIFAQNTSFDLVISQYLIALEASPYFTNVQPVFTERDIDSPMSKANFKIVCDLVY